MTSTNMTYAPDSQSHLEWFTHDIPPNGRQICSIRKIKPPSPDRLVLDEELSTLLQVLLTEIASDGSAGRPRDPRREQERIAGFESRLGMPWAFEEELKSQASRTRITR